MELTGSFSAASLNSRLLQKGLLLNATKSGWLGELSNPVNRPNLVAGPQSLVAFTTSVCSLRPRWGRRCLSPTQGHLGSPTPTVLAAGAQGWRENTAAEPREGSAPSPTAPAMAVPPLFPRCIGKCKRFSPSAYLIGGLAGLEKKRQGESEKALPTPLTRAQLT